MHSLIKWPTTYISVKKLFSPHKNRCSSDCCPPPSSRYHAQLKKKNVGRKKKLQGERKRMKKRQMPAVLFWRQWGSGRGCWPGEGRAWVSPPRGWCHPPASSPGTCQQQQPSSGCQSLRQHGEGKKIKRRRKKKIRNVSLRYARLVCDDRWHASLRRAVSTWLRPIRKIFKTLPLSQHE